MNETATSYRVDAEATVYVDIRDKDAIERVTGPGGDKWREQFYRSIRTAEDVAAHFAFNALANGITDVNRLEGWADIDADAVEIVVEEIETSVQGWTPADGASGDA